jgi:hypothetical protein
MVMPTSRSTFKAETGLPRRRGSLPRAFASTAPEPLRLVIQIIVFFRSLNKGKDL